MNAGERLPGAPEPMHVLRTPEGLHIAADSWGNVDGPLVLLMHGGGQTRHAWHTTGRNLGAAGYYAVAFDLRGHGDSDWASDGDYSRLAYVRDLEVVVRAMGGRKPVLIGASMSAEVALVAVGDGRVNGAALIMVDFAPHTEPEGYERSRSFMAAHTNGFATLDEVADAIAAYRGGERQRSHRGLAKVVRRAADGRYYWHWDPRLLDWRIREYPKRHEYMSACARRLAVPTLLVRGGSSDVVSEAGAREFLQLAPHAEYANIVGADHMIAGDRNDAFGHAAAGFLSKVMAG